MTIKKIQRVLYTFVPSKPFGSLLKISPTNHIFFKIFNPKFQDLEVWFTDSQKIADIRNKRQKKFNFSD